MYNSIREGKRTRRSVRYARDRLRREDNDFNELENSSKVRRKRGESTEATRAEFTRAVRRWRSRPAKSLRERPSTSSKPVDKEEFARIPRVVR